MAQVQCRTEIPKTEGADETLTVGRTFSFLCEGPWPKMDPQKLSLLLEKEDQYKLKLLDFQFTTPTEAQLTVTSYLPGDHQLKAVQIVDAENSVVLGDLQFTVKSVINPQDPPKEPFGPMGPFSLQLPIWYPLAIAALIAVAVALIWRRIYVDRQKVRLLKEMQIQETSVQPYFQFYQVLRKLQRSYSFYSGQEPSNDETAKFLNELNVAYKIYLARQFQVPTLKWKERQILSDLKKNHRKFYSEFRLEIRKGLAELSRAQQSQAAGKDCEQLAAMLRQQVDRMEQWLKGNLP